MATLKEKLSSLESQMTLLGQAVYRAETKNDFEHYEMSFFALKDVERKLKSVRAHIRSKMRVTLAELQARCLHPEKVPMSTRYNAATKTSVVLQEGCKTCKKSFHFDA